MTLKQTVWFYLENIGDYLLQMLPCMCAALVLLLLLRSLRLRRLARLGLSSGPWRECGLLLFVMFCAGLAALTLFPAYFWTRDHWRAALAGETALFPKAADWRWQLQHAQMVPFQEIKRGSRGPWVMFLVLANMGIFVPLGFLVSLLWRRPRWWKAVISGFLTSFFVEFIQLFIARSTDIDDVILNTAGALAGYWLFCLFRKFFPRFTRKFQCIAEEKDCNG